MDFNKENSVYKNKYNKEVIKERIINQTIYEIDEVFETYGQLEDLFIMDLGDALDGYNQQTTRKLQERSTSFYLSNTTIENNMTFM